ncbi:hypothetical protein [Zunongwangia sp. HRR-M8]|uniref:hypothetical protein n=1 Tax=Zunongwangia sp. HRR-M8 TaxID=3015170 RepID=UPI0022DDA245|nr:hypothetical protein [Zunongwangia sp. HRR-M8]WBL23714.1 hypothetical protein PBT89_07080 [Zunongwangia sp. HRR-M8]
MFGQVGINTSEPDSLMTLDVNGKVKIRSIDEKLTLELSDHILLPTADGEIKKISVQQLLNDFNFSNLNGTVSKLVTDNTTTLVNIAILGDWKAVNFAPSDGKIGLENFEFNGDYYKVPEDGIYSINYSFRSNSLTSLTFGGGGRLGILKKALSATSLELLEEEALALLTKSTALFKVHSEINTLQRLKKGDELTGAISSGISASLLSVGKVGFNIYKISD